MRVILDPKYYGYCPGLKRSLRIANELADKAKAEARQIFYDVPLAHNTEVTRDLETKGFTETSLGKNIDGKGNYFIVSAHGASFKKMAWLRHHHFDPISATCPTVRRLQEIAQTDFSAGYQIIIFGKKDHAETVGVNGCVNNSAIVIKTIDEADHLKLNKKTSVLCQTTFPDTEFHQLVSALRKNNPNIEVIARSTACPVVKSRILNIAKLAQAEKPDLAVVVGSTTSSNTKLLAHELAQVVPTLMVDIEKDLVRKDFQNVATVLVVSGTSAPPEIVEKVAATLEKF